MKKILIIKLGAIGDVLRTIPLAKTLKEIYPGSNITWLTLPKTLDVLKNSPHIDKVLSLPYIQNEKFDMLYNLDIDKEATELAVKISADKKHGFFSENGYLSAFNLGAEYYLNTVFDDSFKKNNTKTMEEIMFQTAEISYRKQHVPIILGDEQIRYAENYLSKENPDVKNLLGIYFGASSRWPSKAWHENNVKEFVGKALNEGYSILLLGGPNEKNIYEKISEEFRHAQKVYTMDINNSVLEFASLVNLCKAVVTTDTMALHVALALKKQTIGLFFCTSPDEIEGYGLLKKIFSPMLADFFPEKMDQYNEELTKSITPDKVLSALKEINPASQ
ncbi:MAG: glycosyltransferase family 9 protein [Nanoarchaeota archaeon]